jgi:hypothetical protein
MSSPYSLEHLADIRDGARRMVERTRAHEGDLNDLVDLAEGVARHASALAVALTRTGRQLVAIAHPMYSLALMNSKRNEAR